MKTRIPYAYSICLYINLFFASYLLQAQNTPLTDANNNGFLDIYYIEDLDAVRNDLSVNYELLCSLDFADPNSYRSGIVNTNFIPKTQDPANATNAGFPTIGNHRNPFDGNFEGNGNEIRNLYIRGAGGLGLFFRIRGTVTNINLINVYVNVDTALLNDSYVPGTTPSRYFYQSGNRFFAGGLAGINSGGTIVNVSVSGYVNSGPRGMYSGGLVGSNATGGIIRSSYSTAIVEGGGNGRVGGLIGQNNSQFVSNSYATGNILGSSNIVGGFAGENNGSITNCFATGNVEGFNTQIGGFVGRNAGKITNAYATGNTQGNKIVGGFVGHILPYYERVSEISNCYSTGNVRLGRMTVGGFIGYSNGANIIVNNYYSNEACRQGIGRGPSTGITALSIAQFQTLTANSSGLSANNFDFGTNTQYPAVRSYTENNGQQIQGTLLCNQPSPRRQCNEEAITPPTPTLPVTTLADANNNGLFDIYYIEDLDAVRNDLSADYELLRTISFTDPNSYRSGIVNDNFTPNTQDPANATNPGFPPIGNREIVYLTEDRTGEIEGYYVGSSDEYGIRVDREAFQGTFEGNNFEIQNLYIRGDQENNNSRPYIGTEFFAGLFVEINGSVNNLGLTNLYVSAYDFTGGLTGLNSSDGSIQNTYVTGTVRGGTRVGGLIGRNVGNVVNSYTQAQVYGLREVGGLVGQQGRRAAIIASYATGNVEGVALDQQRPTRRHNWRIHRIYCPLQLCKR